MLWFRLFLFTFASLTSLPLAALAQVKATLVSPATSVQPGQPFTVALLLEHEPKWHTYWKFAGTGYPTTLAWELPEGWSASEFSWPVPGLILDRLGTITGNGYEGRLLLPLTLTPPAGLKPGETVELKAMADWLMCIEQCVPGQQAVSLKLPISATPTPPVASVQREIDAQAYPRSAPELAAEVRRLAGGTLTLALTAPDTWKELHFFSDDGLIAYDRPQKAAPREGRIEIPLTLAPDYEGKAERLQGVLAYVDESGQRRGVALDLPLLAASSAPATAGLMGTLVLAFIGGLILNLMPCVFPVIGIKILGFVNQAGADRRQVTWHGLAFSGGVLVSFWALAGVLALLRHGGDQLGWGFQLQSPDFVFVLTAVMLVFGLSMSGVFEFGLSATGVGSNLQTKSGLSGSFFSGVLATVVATPCSAPFLAPALGTALALPTALSFLVFTTIAIGLALPYLLLSLFPAALRALPRPGAWMDTFKQAMAFPLYATAGYLIWVLAGQVGEKALRDLLFGLVLVAMACWLYGRYATFGASASRARLGTWGGLALLAGGMALGWPKAEQAWQVWSPQAVADAQKSNRWIYVDFTARWCATCQTNKALVFSSSEVQDRLKALDVVLLKADWTNRNPEITRELARFGRSAVPVNLIYRPGQPEPELLPEILTPQVVLDRLVTPP